MSNIYRGILVKPTVTTSTTVYTCNATSRAIIQNIQLTNQSGTNTQKFLCMIHLLQAQLK